MPKKSKGDLSKRKTLRKKYSILKNIRNHHRDVRKALKNRPKMKSANLFVQEKAVLRLPNKHSQKEELLAAMIAHRKNRGNTQPTEAEETFEDIPHVNRAELEAIERETDADFLFQLSNAMEVSEFFLYVVDARTPQASVSETLISILKSKDIPIILLLNKRELVPVLVLEQWIAYFQKDDRFNNVIAYTADELLGCMKKLRGTQRQMSVTVVGMPNTGVSTIRSELELIPKIHFNIHDASHTQRESFTGARGTRFIFLPEPVDLVNQPIFGLDCIFREWTTVIQRPEKDMVLFATEILKGFETEKLTFHYKLANAANLSPQEVLERIQQFRGLKTIAHAAKDVVRDFHSGRLKWCCLPPKISVSLDELDLWTFFDEKQFCTQDILVLEHEESESDGEE